MERSLRQRALLFWGLYFADICGLHATYNTTSTFKLGPPTELWKNPEANAEIFEKYVRLFFPSVPKFDETTKPPLTFFVQNPPLRDDPNLPPEVLQSITPVDFLKMDETSLFAGLFAREAAALAEEEEGAAVDELLVNKAILKMELQEVMSVPRNRLTHPDSRGIVGGFLYQKMGRSGLLVTMQDFEHELPMAEFAKANGEKLTPLFESGTNVIGILPGRHILTPLDKPILVGAHWDVIANTSGFNDNGSGVAVMLEAMRVLAGARCFQPDHSVIFVAFDAEESGSFGSLEFVQKFLMPNVIRSGGQLQGAFILDTILTVDRTPNSQDISESWPNTVPDTVDRIERNDRRGDFLAVFARGNEGDLALSDKVGRYFRRDSFGLEEFRLDGLAGQKELPSPKQLIQHSFFWLSDNSRFWFYTEDDVFHSFPAIVLTDTAFLRGYMKQCYHQPCDQATNPSVTELNYDFIANVTQALVYAVADLAGNSKCRLREFEQSNEQSAPPPVKTDLHDVKIVHSNEIESSDEHASLVKEYEDLRHRVDSLGAKLKHFSNNSSFSPPPTTFNYGTQINIGSVRIDLAMPSTASAASASAMPLFNHPTSAKDDLTTSDSRPNIVLGSADVNPEILTNIVRGYYAQQEKQGEEEEKEVKDRRRYKGKHKNSPMLIKLLSST